MKVCLTASLGLDLPGVELQLLSFQDVTVGSATLTRPRRNGGQDASSLELIFEGLLHFALLLPLDVLLLRLLRPLLVDHGVFGLGQLLALFVSQGHGVVGLVPLPEGRGVDHDDGVLHEGLGTDQLAVARVVDDVDDTRLTAHGLGAPGEVAGVESEGAVLLVAAAGSHGVNATRAQLGHGRRAGELELALAADGGALAAGGAALMPVVATDTHHSKVLKHN